MSVAAKFDRQSDETRNRGDEVAERLTARTRTSSAQAQTFIASDLSTAPFCGDSADARTERLRKTKNKVLAARRRMTNAMLALVDATREAPCEDWTADQHVTWLQTECRMTREDLAFLMKFDETLGENRDVVVDKRLSASTVKALIRVDDASRQRAVRMIERGDVLSSKDVARIARVTRTLARTPEQERMLLRKKHMSALVKAVGRTLLRNLDQAAGELLEQLGRFQADYFDMSIDTSNVEHDDGTRKGLPDERTYEERHTALQEIAKNARVLFEAVFGSEHAGMQNWHRIPSERPELLELAMAWKALSSLANGEFGRRGGFDLVGECDHSSTEMLESVAYIAGRILDPTPSNDREQPRDPLTSLELCAGAGGEAIGLMSAGFRNLALVEKNPSAVATLRSNWPSWNIVKKDLKSDATLEMMMTLKAGAPITLLAAGTPCQPFSTLGNRGGENDERQLFDRMRDYVQILRPKAFYFENVTGFMENNHLSLRSRLITEFDIMGYNLHIFQMDARHYGLAQDRTRIIFAGILKSDDRGFQPPILSRKRDTDLVNAVGDLVLEYIQSVTARSQEPGSIAYEQACDEWYADWCKKAESEAVPTLTTLRQLATPTECARWAAIGFDRNAEPNSEGCFSCEASLIPLTIPILKRLQGLPDEWQIAGGRNGQSRQIANAFPPIMAKAVALSLRAAITGEPIDLDAELDATLIDKHKIGKDRRIAPTPRRPGRPRKVPPAPASTLKPPASAYALWHFPRYGRFSGLPADKRVEEARRQIVEHHFGIGKGPPHLRWYPIEAGPPPWAGPWNARARVLEARLEHHDFIDECGLPEDGT